VLEEREAKMFEMAFKGRQSVHVLVLRCCSLEERSIRTQTFILFHRSKKYFGDIS